MHSWHLAWMTDDVPTQLEPEEQAWIEEARSWVKGHFNDEADSQYETLAGKLGVIAAVLDNGWVQPTDTWKLQSLGVAFGDAVAQGLRRFSGRAPPS